jgi:hypothetical protein
MPTRFCEQELSWNDGVEESYELIRPPTTRAPTAIGRGIAISAVAITPLDRDVITSSMVVSPLAMAIACRIAVPCGGGHRLQGGLETVNTILQTVPATMEAGTTETGKTSRTTQAGARGVCACTVN